MGIKIKIDKKVRKALGIRVQNNQIVKDTSILVPEVRKEFRIKGVKPIRKALLRDVTKGISPVQGQGKFAPYSKSYRDVIAGKGMFRKIGGKAVFIEGVKDEALLGAASPTKRRSPVTLRLTGELHRTLKLFTTGGFTASFRLVFDWRDFLADIHNRRGAGKSKVVRRMLPTDVGESFNKAITDTILDRLNKAAKAVARRFS